jgi:hypothetical protein
VQAIPFVEVRQPDGRPISLLRDWTYADGLKSSYRVLAMLSDPVIETLCGAFRKAERWEAASDRRERHHQALAFVLGYVVSGPDNSYVLTELGAAKCRELSKCESLDD